MRVLVTGGAGFIGSHLVDELLALSHHVTVLDNLSTGKISNLARPADVEFVEGDVADDAAVSEAIRGAEAVIYLAAVASVQASIQAPRETNRTNLAGTITLLEAAAREGVEQFLYANSAAVYGNQDLLPGEGISESRSPDPLTPYAIDKLAGEQYLSFFHSTGRLKGTSFRFFNIFGPRQDPQSQYSGVISIFHDRLTAGLPISVYGDGQQTRDFLYVGDLVKLLVRRLEQSPDEGAKLPVVNVGSGVATSLNHLIDLLAKILDVEPELSFEPERLGDIRHSCTDTTRLRRMFAGTSWTSLQDGLRLLADYRTGTDVEYAE